MPVFKTNEQFPKFLNQDPNNLRSAYYCLLALIRSFKGNVTIVPQALTLIEDNNEICRHFMSMFLFHNHRNKKWPRQQAP
jgi:hypothetical protein